MIPIIELNFYGKDCMFETTCDIFLLFVLLGYKYSEFNYKLSASLVLNLRVNANRWMLKLDYKCLIFL